MRGAPTTRQELFDFVVAESARREPEDVRRIRPLRVALQNRRDDLLASAGVLDTKLAHIAQTHETGEDFVPEACVPLRLTSTYAQSWNRLRAKIGGKFHTQFDAVTRVMAQTPRSSALVEKNPNSGLRTYFTLPRHLGNAPNAIARSSR
jgi:hypothetical protein